MVQFSNVVDLTVGDGTITVVSLGLTNLTIPGHYLGNQPSETAVGIYLHSAVLSKVYLVE